MPTFATPQGLQAGLAAQSKLAALHHQREPGIDVLLALFLQADRWGPISKMPKWGAAELSKTLKQGVQAVTLSKQGPANGASMCGAAGSLLLVEPKKSQAGERGSYCEEQAGELHTARSSLHHKMPCCGTHSNC